MTSIITETSNYIMTLCLALFMGINVFLLIRKNNGYEKYLYVVQNVLTLFFHFTAFFTLYIRSDDVRYVFFFAYQELLLFGFLTVFRIIYSKCNVVLLNNMVLLLFVGFTVLSRLDIQNAKRQFIITICVLALFMVIPFLLKKTYKYLSKLTWIYFAVGASLLLGVYFLGEVTHGSKLAFQFGFIAFQPSEFVKISLIFFISSILYTSKSLIKYGISFVAVMLHVGILVLSRDLGGASIYFVTYAFLVYFASERILVFSGLTAIGGVASIFAYKKFSHVRVRVNTWLNPWSDINKKGYQLTQSLFAIGTGGWFGIGLLRGAPSTIPYVNKDFIFSAISEEMGLAFALILIFVYLICYAEILQNISGTKDKFAKLLMSGFGIMILFQVFLTVGGGTRLIPLTGVTLPLISTGGSSITSTLLMFGIIQGVLIIQKTKEGVIDETIETEEQQKIDLE